MVTGLVAVDGAFCFMKYNQGGIAQVLLHELKYKGNTDIGINLGLWFGNYIKKELFSANVDCIVPVPLHKKKLKSRGYNQCQLIAAGMTRATGIPTQDNELLRLAHAQTQTKKGKIDRWLNTEGVYGFRNSQIFSGKNVLLVDDVITTGATMVSALEALSDAGVNKLYMSCIASGR